ncbi:MAG: TonB-dependent receptor, partial [Phycisphaerales bacterium]|nr:TonB-dependent receptor [Phycisphaerales bacterium]
MIEGPANRRANAGGEPTRRWLHRWRTTAGLGVALLVSGTAAAQFIDESYFEDLDEFANLTVEDLLDFRLDVTSVAGTRQSWFTTPAGMTLLTPEAIRRGGHRSVAEALRLVPGVQVAQTNASTWSVSSRGDTRFANKMLVMIDGRATYDLLFSGTFWDVQDPLLEDLDRIEVVRGPGATLWGANAVNGVVSIVTKSARETQGLLVKGGIGTQDEASGAIRYGLTLGDDAWMRVWGKYRHHGGFERGADDWDLGHGGLRLDVQPEDDLAWTIEAEAYETGRIGEIVVRPTPLGHLTTDTVRRDGRAAGGHVRGRVTRDGANGWSLQSYYDHTTRVIADGFEVDRDTFDLDFRRRHTGSGHDLHWG